MGGHFVGVCVSAPREKDPQARTEGQ